MVDTVGKIYFGTPSTELTTVYTVPAGKKLIIKNIVFCNTFTAEATVTINLANLSAFKDSKIYSKDTTTADPSTVLHAGDTIAVSQATANAINLFISGVEI